MGIKRGEEEIEYKNSWIRKEHGGKGGERSQKRRRGQPHKKNGGQ